MGAGSSNAQEKKRMYTVARFRSQEGIVRRLFSVNNPKSTIPIMPRTAVKPKIAIVGPGSLGNALALSLREAGYRVTEVVSRRGEASRRRAQALARKIGATATTFNGPRLTADVVWLCVPDGKIAACARSLASAEWEGKVALHSSGALTSDELNALRRKGAAVASLHPLMTFVRKVRPMLAGVPFAIEGDIAAIRAGRRIVRDLGGEVFVIEKRYKPAYHAWGAFTSPLLVAILVVAEEVAELAGINRTLARRRMLPIVRQTIANYAREGPAGAFSGPIVRGDAATLKKHVQALRGNPEAKEVYLALARSAIKNLPARNQRLLKQALG
jgi:predicted short-subunit dehydrogenase-like oxidoreductase (DUF2520 family)